jgi:hypothetical protein
MAVEYWEARNLMATNRDAQLVRQEPDESLEAAFHATPLPADLPTELAEYLEGVMAYENGNVEKARALWQQLLARPAPERRFRSTWAAYMLGRMAAWDAAENEARRAEAIRWLQDVRTLAQEGCEDGLNLVGLSYYWEARLQKADDLEDQARLGGLSLAAGCAWAVKYLQGVGESILEIDDDSVRAHAARVPLLRQLATANALVDLAGYELWQERGQNEGEDERLARWLAAVDKTGITEVEDADRLAWACYDLGHFGTASAWLKKAPAHAPMALWLHGKLALRAGRNAEATQDFTLAARHFPQPAAAIYPEHNWWYSAESDDFQFVQAQQLQADLAIAELARARFPQALEHFLQSGAWLDAAYVAEQVMTTQELTEFLRRHPMPEDIPAKPKADEPGFSIPESNFRKSVPQALRYLLARRLARDGRLDEARKYMPGPLLDTFDAYCSEDRPGHDHHLSAAERAADLWEAACIHRRSGMELFGTEAAPDWSFYEGQYECSEIGGLRSGTVTPSQWLDEKVAKVPWLPRPSAVEITRYMRQRPRPNARFHYRHVAAELGWQAAKLRPPDEETAEMLCTAGGWLKDRDSKAADRFYQELVGRCGKTALGIEGEKRRWFPPSKDPPFRAE